VVGPEAHVGITDVHIAIGNEQVALLLLRAAGRKICHAPGCSWQVNLLSETGSESSEVGKDEKT
jgi:hypothetical protein